MRDMYFEFKGKLTNHGVELRRVVREIERIAALKLQRIQNIGARVASLTTDEEKEAMSWYLLNYPVTYKDNEIYNAEYWEGIRNGTIEAGSRDFNEEDLFKEQQ